jgi:type VI secretion system protein ImpG
MTRDELLLYYERELRFIRRMAMNFAEKYPEIAGRLLLEPQKCEDPHVERLIEAFAMLTARVHQRIDDDFSEISDALLSILYPHYLAPVPSMTIVRFEVDPDVANVEGGFQIREKSLLYTRPVAGVRCCFRTAYPLRIFPVEVAEVGLVNPSTFSSSLPASTQSALRIRLRALGGARFHELGMDSLRLFLDAPSGEIHSLYELFLRDPQGLVVREKAGAREHLLPAHAIRPVGFDRDEGLLEYPRESFLGYRLLQEYFVFPEKFLFVELGGIEKATRDCDADEIELHVLLSQSIAQLDLRVDRENLKLDCTPAVNLFPLTADPIRLTHAAVEYPVVPDARAPHSYEVHSIVGVSALVPGTAESRSYSPFYGIRHGSAAAGEGAFWHATRRPSMRKSDSGSDVFLSLVDDAFSALDLPVDVLHVETLCTNRELPARLPFGDPAGDFQLEGRPGVSRIAALRKPTEPLPAPIRAASRWRLISHLSLNYLSISDDGGLHGTSAEASGKALTALQEILRLYDFSDSAVTRQRILGLVGLRSRPTVRRAGRGGAAGFARGVEAQLEFDPSQYTGSGLFLFASVLERFLGLYTSVNSFVQTVARVRQQPGELKRWPPRAGETQLL